jgi:hypothetical protein
MVLVLLLVLVAEMGMLSCGDMCTKASSELEAVYPGLLGTKQEMLLMAGSGSLEAPSRIRPVIKIPPVAGAI